MFKAIFKQNYKKIWSFGFGISTFAKRSKTPMIDLKAMKEDLGKPKIASVFPEPKKVEKIGEKIEKKEQKTDKKTLENYFIQKEKEVSSKILKLSTEKDLMKLFFEEKHKKPIHYSLMFHKMISIHRNMRKLQKMQNSELIKDQKKDSPQKIILKVEKDLWENKNFILICENVLRKFESMNPDSIINLLRALSLIKIKKIGKDILRNLIEFLVKENNVLLFDGIQCAKVLFYLRKNFKKTKTLIPNTARLVKLVTGKIKSEIPVFSLSINKKLYSCLFLISSTGNEAKILDLLNKKFSKHLYKLKPNELLTVLNGNYIISSKNKENSSSKFIDSLINEFEKKAVVQELKPKELNIFLQILISGTFTFLNNDIFIEQIVQKQVSNCVRYIRFKLKNPNIEKIYVSTLNDFLSSLRKINYSNNETILNFFSFLKDTNVSLMGNNYVDIVIFLSNLTPKTQKDDKTNISDLLGYFCLALSKNSFHINKHEEFGVLLKSLAKAEMTSTEKIKTLENIVKRSFGFFFNNIHKFSDLNICRFLISFRFFSTETSLNLLELLVKSINRIIFKNEYYSFEEMEEIKKNSLLNFDKNSQKQRISSYQFIKDDLDAKHKLLIRKYTQIINSLWVCCSLFLKDVSSHELKASIIWKEFAFCLKNIVFSGDLLTIDNIQKLHDIQKILEINNFPETEIFFKGEVVTETLKKQEEFILGSFPEKNKKLRNTLLKKIEEEINKRNLKNQIQLENCKIIKNVFPVDICLTDTKTNRKIGIILSHIYEERNSDLNIEKDSFVEFFRIKSNTIKHHFDNSEISYITQENDAEFAKIKEFLRRCNNNNIVEKI